MSRLGIPVQALVINQCIQPEVVEGNRFLASRAKLQTSYLKEIESRFTGLLRSHLPLLDHDVSDLPRYAKSVVCSTGGTLKRESSGIRAGAAVRPKESPSGGC